MLSGSSYSFLPSQYFGPPSGCCNKIYNPSINSPSALQVYCPSERCRAWYHLDCQSEARPATFQDKKLIVEQGLDVLQEILDDRLDHPVQEAGVMTKLEKDILNQE